MAYDEQPSPSERLRRERDLYRDLLELGRRDNIGPFLEQALELVVRLSGARRGYIELFEDRKDDVAPRMHVAHGCYDEDVDAIREALSQGIMAEAIATGRTITIESALLDPRFNRLRSVQRNRIEAVLCAPIGASPPIGVVYLQDREPSGPFSEDDRRLVEDLARHLATFASRLLVEHRRRDDEDPTQPFRDKLHAQAARVVGRSRALGRVLERVAHAAPQLHVGILFTGPCGTGKTELARLLHDSSPRAGHPFIELNCASIPETLVESELFGTEAGAFSGAQHREGRVTAARGGTLFLDEIGELPLVVQPKLLQFLQSKEYYPLGAKRKGAKEPLKPLKADVRIVAATNANLSELISKKAFRDDLYYRIAGYEVRVPSLEERREDIPLLAQCFCERVAEENGMPRLSLSEAALHALRVADWPGNIRQLFNRIQSAAVTATGEGVHSIERRHLFPDGEAAAPSDTLTYQDATRHFQKQYIQRVLETNDWNVTKAASILDLTRPHLHNLIAGFDLKRKKP